MKSGEMSGVHFDTVVQSIPTSFIRSGYYYIDSGELYVRTSAGYYWQSVADSNKWAKNLGLKQDYLTISTNPNIDDKGYGFSIRCLVR